MGGLIPAYLRRGSNRLIGGAVVARRDAEALAEGGGEAVVGVAHALGDGGDRQRGAAQQFGGAQQALFAQPVEWGFAVGVLEVAVEAGAVAVGEAGQFVEAGGGG
jgi:hypothetical protein